MSYRLDFFNTWQAGYANASVAIRIAGTQTLASVFTDEALTKPAANPQTLASLFKNDVGYGKFASPLYAAQAVTLAINGTDETGVLRPAMTSLVGQDASAALVTPAGGAAQRSLDDVVADVINAENIGPVGPSQSTATNTATINAAISAAAGLGGADVLLPEGAYSFTLFSAPTGVVLVGRGRGVTIIQSQTAGKVITLSGDRAGLRNLTLDGVNLQAGSIGLYAKAKNEIVLDDVEIKRFETGWQKKGGRRGRYNDVYIDNCVNGADWRGDNDAGSGGGGDEIRGNRWRGGRVTACTGVGVHLQYIDKKVFNNDIDGVSFENNLGTALKINGARFTELPGCRFSGNTTNWVIQDGTDVTKSDENTIVGVQIGPGGAVIGGTSTFNGRCQSILLNRIEISAGAVMSLPLAQNPILALDCLEDTSVVVSGSDSQRWLRAATELGNAPGSFGVTTDATPTVAYRFQPDPGSTGVIDATIAAHQRNGIQVAVYRIARGFKRTGSTLAYQNQTANFTLGDMITGATSGAKARVIADSDSGTTGTLTLKDITKEFINGEIVAGAIGGSAQVNGALAHQNAALLGSTTAVIAAVEDDVTWDADFAVSGYEVRVVVTGAAAKTIEWNVHCRVTPS